MLLPVLGAVAALSGDEFETEPINYTKSAPQDRVTQLQGQIDRGQVTLKRSGLPGYLVSVLQQLQIPVSSQVLVFSKTSFQRDYISPRTPRALYFNDDTYVGWVQGGEVLEFSTADPQLGAVFYVLRQEPAAKPKFERQTYECLSCHSSTLTRGVPGHTVRSVFPGRDGQPALAAGTFVTSDESPMEERWGGWYVTGTHGQQRHMGNVTVKDAAQAETLDRSTGANATDLRRWFDASPYLTKHSDIVALMVLEHQTSVQNLITRANQETRKALHYEQALNRELGRGPDFRSDSTLSRVRSVGDPLVRGLLFAKEAPLTAPVAGTSGFSREFAARGPWDKQRRSLRDFDLRTRLFKYPCSYLVYSKAFDGLPPLAKEYVYTRLGQVLRGEDTSAEFARLSPADRKAALEILMATKPDFAAFQAQPATGPPSPG